jgi:uncharacterized protein YjbJ (UPF0337 family)
MGARMKQLTGRIKHAAGSLIGNTKPEREGWSERRLSQARQRFDDATDKVGDVIDTSADAAADAVAPDRTGQRPA